MLNRNISADVQTYYVIGQTPGRVVQGIVLYAGERVLPFGESDGVKLWAVPLGMLAG